MAKVPKEHILDIERNRFQLLSTVVFCFSTDPTSSTSALFLYTVNPHFIAAL